MRNFLRKVLSSDLLENVVFFLKRFYPFLILAFAIWFVFFISSITDSCKKARINEKQIRLYNKKINTTSEDDSLVVDELRKLREHEIVIIYTHYDEKVRIKRIPDDSLQYWADSLYNGTK